MKLNSSCREALMRASLTWLRWDREALRRSWRSRPWPSRGRIRTILRLWGRYAGIHRLGLDRKTMRYLRSTPFVRTSSSSRATNSQAILTPSELEMRSLSINQWMRSRQYSKAGIIPQTQCKSMMSSRSRPSARSQPMSPATSTLLFRIFKESFQSLDSLCRPAQAAQHRRPSTPKSPIIKRVSTSASSLRKNWPLWCKIQGIKQRVKPWRISKDRRIILIKRRRQLGYQRTEYSLPRKLEQLTRMGKKCGVWSAKVVIHAHRRERKHLRHKNWVGKKPCCRMSWATTRCSVSAKESPQSSLHHQFLQPSASITSKQSPGTGRRISPRPSTRSKKSTTTRTAWWKRKSKKSSDRKPLMTTKDNKSCWAENLGRTPSK